MISPAHVCTSAPVHIYVQYRSYAGDLVMLAQELISCELPKIDMSTYWGTRDFHRAAVCLAASRGLGSRPHARSATVAALHHLTVQYSTSTKWTSACVYISPTTSLGVWRQ